MTYFDRQTSDEPMSVDELLDLAERRPVWMTRGECRTERALTLAWTFGLEQAVDLFKLDVGRYPNDAEGLRALVERPATVQGWNGPYLKKGLPVDPWGAAYQYKFPGRHGGPDIFSLGADGKPGGESDNADIYN